MTFRRLLFVAWMVPVSVAGAAGSFNAQPGGGHPAGWGGAGGVTGEDSGIYYPLPGDQGTEGAYPWYGYSTQPSGPGPGAGRKAPLQPWGESPAPWGPEYGYPAPEMGGMGGMGGMGQGGVGGRYRFREVPGAREERDTRPIFRPEENKGRAPYSSGSGMPYWQEGGMTPPPVFRPLDQKGGGDNKGSQGVYPGYPAYPPGPPPGEFDGYPSSPAPFSPPW